MDAEFRIVPLAYWSAVPADGKPEGSVVEMKLTPEQKALIEQSQQHGGKDVGEAAAKQKSKDKARTRKAKAASGKENAGEEDEAMDDEGKDGGDDDEEDEDTDFEAGDKVTEEMMLPPHLR
jgi:mRNA turnover protein 4